jgi:ER lumen protein retaining receptor
MYFLGTLMRCIYVFDTRLINNYFIFFELIFSVALFIYIVYLFYKYRFTRFSEINSKIATWKVIVPVCVILSFFFHPGNKLF